MAKEGPIFFFLTTNFLVKIEFTYFSMGLIHNFHAKKGPLFFFFFFFFGLKGGPEKFSRIFVLFLHQASPLQVFVNGPLIPGCIILIA